MDGKTIGVVGAGIMGRGIVQLFAQAGHRVLCHDAAPGAAQGAADYVSGMLDRQVEKGKLNSAKAAEIKAAIVPVPELAGLVSCDVVIEAIVERLDAKRALFSALEDVVADDAILASNTSSLVVAEIAAGSRRPERIAGLHFFNPVPLMKVAEVIAAVRTAPAAIAALKALVEHAGHRAVVAADQPGFLVNHAGRGFYTEGLRLLEERVAGVQAIDTVLREAAGFRMGPFELFDLTGIDVSGKVLESIYEQFHHEPRYRPSALIPPRIAAGLYGRKSGEGWYRYGADGKAETEEPLPAPPLPSGLSVWVDPAAARVIELCALVERVGLKLERNPVTADLLIVQPWGSDAGTYAAKKGLDASRLVAVDPLPAFDKHRTLMSSVATTIIARDAARALLGSDGVAVTSIQDSPGFIVQRVLATIVNIASEIAQRGIATVADIEDAVTLGLGYPRGPLSWGDRIGAARVLEILSVIHAQTGDPRYRPSPWLRQRASLGLSLLAPSATLEQAA
ncbi:MAG: 3-hydroxyacyl-CoA dehydrogenase [Pseudoxanthomonas sp.]